MTSVFSHNFRVLNAEKFIGSLAASGSETSNVYITIGKPTTWANEADPPMANTSTMGFNEVWRYMIGAKKITGNDVRHVIPRHDWTANTTYIAYDDGIDSDDLQNLPFYVLTDEWNVYKCLSNNSGSISTVKPTSTLTTGAVETSDNYIWKYMYSLTAEERLRFTTADYMPVRTLENDNGSLQWQVQDDAIEGAIEAIFITSGGSGYSNANTITVTVTGDGTGANLIARINSTTNVVSSIVATNPGAGYSFATITISDTGSGTNATARAVISPSGGHGSNPLNELGGGYVMINARIRGTEDGKLPIDNELRQVAIILNPYRRGTTNIASNTVYSQVTTLTLDTGATSYEEDEVVFQGPTLATYTFKGTVLAWDDANSIIKLIDVVGTPQSDVLTGETSRAARLVQSVTTNDLKPFSGQLLYVDNITPIQRADDQTEDFKIVIQF